MQAKDIMTEKAVCCTPEAKLQKAAELMAESNCGEIPVVENQKSMKPVGVLTDRDIVCRAVAKGKDPSQAPVRECMSKPAITVKPETDAAECCRLMAEWQIRRIPVVDDKGACCGIVALADVARCLAEHEAAICLREISLPVPERSIEERAYQLFLERGQQPGHELEHWVLAEQEFLGRSRGRQQQFAG